jgi:hypothetical protein
MSSFGFDINNPDSAGTRGSVNVPDAYYTAIVEDIIINNKNGKVLRYKADGSNLGQAKVRLIPHDQNTPIQELNDAYPMDINIQAFPLVGEQVMIFKASGTLFYTRLSLKRKLTENVTRSTQRKFTERLIATGARVLTAVTGVPANYTDIRDSSQDPARFISNPSVRFARAYVGDILMQGRYGQTIRLGSSLFKKSNVILPKPNILLTAGFWSTPRMLSTEEITPYSLTEENINKDRSSIWMVSEQEVPFVASTIDGRCHQLSSPNKTKDYIGAQIFVNSDRVILNSKQREISLFSKAEINLNALGAISLDTDSDIFLRSFGSINLKANGPIYLEGTSIDMVASKNLTYNTAGDYGISGKRIFIGKYGDTTQPMVLGTQLAKFLTQVLTNLSQLTTIMSTFSSQVGTTLSVPTAYTVTVASLGVPTPAVPAGAATLAAAASTAVTGITSITTQLGILLQGTNPLGAQFNSSDNFVSKENT